MGPNARSHTSGADWARSVYSQLSVQREARISLEDRSKLKKQTETSSSPGPAYVLSCLITTLRNVGDSSTLIPGVADKGNQAPATGDVSGLSQGLQSSEITSERIHFTKDQCTEISGGGSSVWIPNQSTLEGVVSVLAGEQGSTGATDDMDLR